MLDYDATGKKRFVNGGNLDTLEKVLPWVANVGSPTFDQSNILSNNKWLKWSIDDGMKNNLVLKRNMTIPDSLSHQTILVAFKFVSRSENTIIQKERFDIYINGVHSGTGDSGTHSIGGVETPKTIYAVYNLIGDESNLEVALVRSPTQSPTPVGYNVLIQSSFVGLHTLGNSSYSLNFPVSGSAFIGAGADIESFYNFKNNAVRPIPSFLINEDRLEGNGSLTVNITSQAPETRGSYYLGKTGAGNKLGESIDNKMSVEDFLQIKSFSASSVDVYLDQEDDYDNFVFDNGNFLVHFSGDTIIDSIYVDNASSVTFLADDLDEIQVNSINIKGKSRLEVNIPNGDFVTNDIYGSENSYLQINTGTMSMPVLSGGLIYLEDSSKLDLNFVNDTKLNADGKYGFGALLSNIKLEKYSFLDINSRNSDINVHIGRSMLQSESIFINNHCHVNIKGFNILSTGSTEKKFVGKLHSSIEIETPVQIDGGPTSFTDIELALFSTFGSTVPVTTLTEDLIESFVYEI